MDFFVKCHIEAHIMQVRRWVYGHFILLYYFSFWASFLHYIVKFPKHKKHPRYIRAWLSLFCYSGMNCAYLHFICWATHLVVSQACNCIWSEVFLSEIKINQAMARNLNGICLILTETEPKQETMEDAKTQKEDSYIETYNKCLEQIIFYDINALLLMTP